MEGCGNGPLLIDHRERAEGLGVERDAADDALIADDAERPEVGAVVDVPRPTICSGLM